MLDLYCIVRLTALFLYPSFPSPLLFSPCTALFHSAPNTPHATGSAWSVRHRLRKWLVLWVAPADTELHPRALVQQGAPRRTWRRTQPAPVLFPQRHAGGHAAALRCPRRPLALCASFHRMYPATLRLFCMLHARAPLRPHSSSPRRCSACTLPHAAPRAPTRRRSSALSSAQCRGPAAAALRHAPSPSRAPRCARAAVSSTASTVARARHSPATRQRLAARAPVGPLCSPMHAHTPQRLPGATAFVRVVTALVGALQPFSAHLPTPLLRAHAHAHTTPCPPRASVLAPA
jgi:hypothetical protein